MEEASREGTSLALLIDADPTMRSQVRPVLEDAGLEIIHARSSVAALELLQRMRERFRLVLVSMEMPGLPGLVLLETLRLFRPHLSVLCLTRADAAGVGAAEPNCLPKPLRQDELRARLAEALAGTNGSAAGQPIDPEALARARATFAASGSLLDAARELARALPGTTTDGW